MNDLGDFLSSLISTGLRGAAAFLTASSEASQKVAVVNSFNTYNNLPVDI